MDIKNPIKQHTAFHHPGFGRRQKKYHAKGRPLDDDALQEVSSLVGTNDLQRDMLIEYLHVLHDHFGYLSQKHMHALAHFMRLSQVEIYEVASFYAHFTIIHDDEPCPPAITIRVCDSVSCMLAGSKKFKESLENNLDPTEIRILKAPCMGHCDQAPVAEVGKKHIYKANLEKIKTTINNKDFKPAKTNHIGYDDYCRDGGYDLLNDIICEKISHDDIISVLNDSGLRGLGGAGFPTGRKWDLVRKEPGKRLMAVNGDEGEPGTFKDYYILSQDPHRFLEGMLIGAHVIAADAIYIYLRDEYPDIHKMLQSEIALLPNCLTQHTKIHLRRGAGAYICGEESAMIESIEGKRGLPRHRPPYVAQKGIFGCPTLVNNIETLFWVRELYEKKPEWFTNHGMNGRKGLRRYSVSGRVKTPGVKLAPAGITIQQLIDEYCDGMADGHNFKGYLPGGASGGILPASMNDIPLDFDTLQPFDCFIGSAAVVVLSNHDNIADVALNLMQFFEDESCGQCTPCRVGTEKLSAMMIKKIWDKDLLQEISQTMADASICGLGQAAPNPLLCVLKHFPEDIPT